MKRRILFGLLFVFLVLTGCQGFLINSTKPVMVAIIVKPAFEVFLQEDDLELAMSAVGGQIKLAEILRKNMPNDPHLNLLLCQGFASYGQLFEPGRDAFKYKGDDASDKEAKRITARIRKLALRGQRYCMHVLDRKYPGFAKLAGKNAKAFEELLKKVSKQDVRYLFWLGYAWGYAITNGLTEPELVAQLPQLRMVMERVVQLDETFFHGGAHLFLGTLYSQSKMFGGDLKKAKGHFEKAFTISKKRLLLMHFYKARFYANQTNNTKECKALVKEVLAAPERLAPELMLVNQLAKAQARVAQKYMDDFCP